MKTELKKYLKVAVALLALLIFDRACSTRDLESAPPFDGKMIAGHYDIYKPSVFAEACRQFTNIRAEDPYKGGGMKAFNDRFNYYADSAMHIELKYQMAILMPFIILFFILSVFVVNRILHKTGLDLRLSGKTEKGTSFRNS